MDPFSAAVSVAAATVSGIQYTVEFANKFRDAQAQIRHDTDRLLLLGQTIEHLDKLPERLKQQTAALTRELTAAREESAGHTFDPRSKRSRLRWLFTRGSHSATAQSRQMATETTSTLNLVVDLVSSLTDMQDQLDVVSDEIKTQLVNIAAFNQETLRSLARLRTSRTPSRRTALILRARRIRSSLGWVMRLTITGDKTTYTAFCEFPMRKIGWIIQFHHRIRSYFNLWPTVSFLRQNAIPDTSEVVRVCETGDLPRLQQLLMAGQVGPNDVTPSNNSTLLLYAIESGSPEVVRCLLQHGADPNLTYGERQSCPLNDAFYYGRVEMIRALLEARADIDYINDIAWTSLSYIWDPKHRNENVIELLDIFRGSDFDGWNTQDACGWSPICRAAAFGSPEELRHLISHGGSLDILTYFFWQPIHCAVWFGNWSTFEFLSAQEPPAIHGFYPERRGWTLLHLAAQNGSYDIIYRLVRDGADINRLSFPSDRELPELLNRRLLPREIAEAHGHKESFDQAVAAAQKDAESKC